MIIKIVCTVIPNGYGLVGIFYYCTFLLCQSDSIHTNFIFMSIINNTDYTFTPDQQQAIQNAAANINIDNVYAIELLNGGFYDFADVDNNYLFSLEITNRGTCSIIDRR